MDKHNSNELYEITQLLLRAEEIAKLGHWRWDIQQDTIFWSDEIYKIHGVSKENHTPDLQTGIDFYHPEDKPKVEEYIKNALEKGENFDFELRIITPDNVIKYVRSCGECNLDEKGKPISIFGVFHDITESKIKELELNDSKKFLKKVIDSIPDLIFVKDEEFKITMANKAFLDMYDDKDKVIGYTTYENFPEDQVRVFTEQDQLAFSQGNTEKLETVTSLQLGETKTVFTKKVSFKDARGEKFLLGIARDVTELIEIQNKLSESEERFELAVNASLSGIWDWDVVTNDLFWSDRFKEIVGIEDRDFQANYDEFESRLHPDDKMHTLNALHNHLETKEPYDVEYQLRRVDGAYVWIHARGQALWNSDGKPLRMIGTVTDVSDRKKYQHQIQEYLSALITSNRELDDFAHIASHDLKEPLRGISTYSQILIEDYDDKLDEEGRRKLDILTKLSKRIGNLLDSLLEFSRVGRIKFAIQQTDLNETIKDVLETLQVRIEMERVGIKVVGNLPRVFCDHVKIAEVFNNLITNAIKYNESVHKKIEIGIVQENSKTLDMPCFYVKDNGIGIEKEYSDKVFEIFQRLHQDDEYGGGTGSGLTIVKKIIERHKGMIWVDKNEWGGSTFFFTLPQRDIEKQELVANG